MALYFNSGWKRHSSVTLDGSTVRPMNPGKTGYDDRCWDIMVSEDMVGRLVQFELREQPNNVILPYGHVAGLHSLTAVGEKESAEKTTAPHRGAVVGGAGASITPPSADHQPSA